MNEIAFVAFLNTAIAGGFAAFVWMIMDWGLEGKLKLVGFLTGGLWLHHSADMRDGFQTELFNSRGVHSWTAGREEQKLVEKYRTQAEEVEACGHHRLASSLRKLATLL
jgi:hypothetical protein